MATWVGLAHAYQLTGNMVDYLLVGSSPRQGATVFHGGAIAVGYLLMAAVFVTMGACARGTEDEVLSGECFDNAAVDG